MPADLVPSGLQDTARVVVIHHPSCRRGARIADAIARHFEGQSELIGMRPITTRVLSEAPDPADSGGLPPMIDTDASAFFVAILLADTALTDALGGPWSGLRDTLVRAMPPVDGRPERGFSLTLVIAMDEGAVDPLQTEEALPHSRGSIQAERAYDWPRGVSDAHAMTRILLQACRLILDGLDRIAQHTSTDTGPRRRLVFLSHAKADLEAAESEGRQPLVRRLTERMRDTNYGLEAYLDETHALAGWPWKDQLRRAIERGALVVLDTDTFAARPICQWELLEAKRARRPILSIGAVRERQPISFAYGGNLPSTRAPELDDDANVDRLLLDLMTEMVRIELWRHEARAVVERAEVSEPVLLPRPVELTDLAFHLLDRDGNDSLECSQATLVYPDPPLSRDLRELIDALRPGHLHIVPLSELSAVQ